ncbi:hypothetical protein [Ruegeria sp. THAF33]|uniref:hypothetical protein n=1 Tax=Ruegeria sp. THAF33 TaxID=2587853 RepID=UPI001267EF91|nr:hypothetical protein [Ruegeria sp. THAF33]QFT74946.1 hypothetical protein FIU92_18050 [Ruegeria sp. THAF33]
MIITGAGNAARDNRGDEDCVSRVEDIGTFSPDSPAEQIAVTDFRTSTTDQFTWQIVDTKVTPLLHYEFRIKRVTKVMASHWWAWSQN